MVVYVRTKLRVITRIVRTLLIVYRHKEKCGYTNHRDVTSMPRKSLMGSGKSPRVNFRMDEEVEKILQETKDKSRFIREAIVFYSEHLGNRDIYPTKIVIPREKAVETKQPEIKSNDTWNPPWLSR